MFDQGYIASKSGHTRGSTFDLTIIPIDQEPKEIEVNSRTLSDGSTVPFLDDNTLDMGSSFDLFHDVSHHDTTLIDEVFLTRRNFLRQVMID